MGNPFLLNLAPPAPAAFLRTTAPSSTSQYSQSPASDAPFSPGADVSMNYSPKHLRQPSSLLSTRNLNMKNLLLNLLPSPTNRGGAADPLDPPLQRPPPPRRKTLTLAIPLDPDPPLVTPATTKTPSLPPQLVAKPRSRTTPDLSAAVSIPFVFPPSNPIPLTSNPFSADLQSPFGHENIVGRLLEMKIGPEMPKKMPEELQELSQLNAYPHGPANVLSDLIFLYSDPHNDPKVDINDYDLVINVAKECMDLSNSYTAKGEYLCVPWLHTSSILDQLPGLTAKMLQYDDSDVSGKRRKILVHCQCGVSRSACVVVAYFMRKFLVSVNDAYELLKLGTLSQAPVSHDLAKRGYKVAACDRICPNMSLIFELMEFGDLLAK